MSLGSRLIRQVTRVRDHVESLRNLYDGARGKLKTQTAQKHREFDPKTAVEAFLRSCEVSIAQEHAREQASQRRAATTREIALAKLRWVANVLPQLRWTLKEADTRCLARVCRDLQDALDILDSPSRSRAIDSPLETGRGDAR